MESPVSVRECMRVRVCVCVCVCVCVHIIRIMVISYFFL